MNGTVQGGDKGKARNILEIKPLEKHRD